MFILDFLALVLVVVGLSGFRVAQEYERGVVFRLGRYRGLRGPGLYWIIPMFERSVRVDIRTRTVSAEQQETITRDSVTIKVNAVLWYRITDAAKAVIAVTDAPAAVYQLALTGLRNIIGQHDLDEILQERNKINILLGGTISGSTAEWGLEVQRFEMKDVELPKAMQQVMAMQAEAIREKRARIIKAEAELEASVKLSAAAAQITMNPAALELRRMQMISEVGAENNSTTVLMIPSDFVSLAHTLNEYLGRQRAAKSGSDHEKDYAFRIVAGRPHADGGRSGSRLPPMIRRRIIQSRLPPLRPKCRYLLQEPISGTGRWSTIRPCSSKIRTAAGTRRRCSAPASISLLPTRSASTRVRAARSISSAPFSFGQMAGAARCHRW